MSSSESKTTRLFNSLVYGLLGKGLVFAAAQIFSFIFSLITARTFKFTKLETVMAIMFGVVIATLFVILLIRIKQKRFRPRFPLIDPSFEILEKTITHEYLNRGRIRHRRKWKLKARKNGLDHFNDHFCWTAPSKEFNMKEMFAEHSIVQTGPRNVFETYAYHFGRTLKKGETIEIGVEWDLIGDNHKEFFSTNIEEPTNKLVLHIKFPESWKMKSVVCTESPILGSKNSNDTAFQIENGEYKWELAPKLYYCYEIKWNLKQVTWQQ